MSLRFGLRALLLALADVSHHRVESEYEGVGIASAAVGNAAILAVTNREPMYAEQPQALELGDDPGHLPDANLERLGDRLARDVALQGGRLPVLADEDGNPKFRGQDLGMVVDHLDPMQPSDRQ